jgi:membrane-bound lytic murein transglycosylase D
MSRITICVTLIILLIGCAGRPIPQLSGASGQELAGNAAPAPAMNVGNPSSQEQRLPRAEERSLEKKSIPPEKVELSKPEQNLSPSAETSLEKAPALSKKIELSKLKKSLPPAKQPSLNKTPALSKKSELSKSSSAADQSKRPLQEGLKENEEEAQQDIMEEALVLLNESHIYWVSGNLEDALEMLDQAYALLLDTNGNPDIARQKDDLRLIISKRILAIYNSIPAVAKGKRSEIPVITNADVEKEIHQFQTVERDFFISSYQRSTMYRPIILRELKKAGLPEELAWLPLVESGFKINALSMARALGLWQFIPSTGYKYGLNRDDWFDERMDIEKSTRAAIDYLKELHTMFGDWLTVLAAYNCGEGRVIRTIASQHINYLDRFWDLYQKLPYETARYVPRFLATLVVIRDPQKYGIDLGAGDGKVAALSYEIAEINKSMRLQDIARKLDISEEVLNILNAELRHRITPDKPYKLKVPLEMAEQLLKVIDEIPRAEAPRASFYTKRGAVIRHKVRRGETLASIASKYKTSVGTITAYNHLSKKRRLVAGQSLNVPIRTSKMAGPTGKTNKPEKIGRHEVQKGDTLTSLARKYDTTVAEIRRFNHLEGDVLKIGQILRIEGDDNEGDKGQKGNSGEESKGKGKTVVKSKSGEETETKTVKKYTVRKGDSLNKIARENNMSLDKLLDINRLAREDNIYPGQVIMIQ